MQYAPLSPKQAAAMLWWGMPDFAKYEGIIADGSIRSGKTVSMVTGFIIWSMSTFKHQALIIAGKTVESLRRNVVTNLRDWLPDNFNITENRSENKVVITDNYGHKNTYYVFGGRDESSYQTVQGLTAAGALLDEVALMPRSFVDQCIARCSVPGSKIWMNCNPASPESYIYKEFVCKAEERKFLHIHFTLSDNKALSPEIIDRYNRMYTGVFYRRYILGEWCVADGLVYAGWSREMALSADITDNLPPGGEYWIAVDYGTHNPFAALLFYVYDTRAWIVGEYYHSGRDTGQEQTPEEYYTHLVTLAGKREIEGIICDPAASEFIVTVQRHNHFSIIKANNSVVEGIRFVQQLFKNNCLLISEKCENLIRELGIYSWNEKATKDEVIKESDHACDAMRYFAYTILRNDPDYMSQFE